MAVIQIFVGSPVDDKPVTVDTSQTVSKVLSDSQVNKPGTIQHNGRTLTANQLNQSLDSLGVVDGDYIYVVTKMDGAV